MWIQMLKLHIGKNPQPAHVQYTCGSAVKLTSEILWELLLQLERSVEGFPRLLLRQTLVHLSAQRGGS